MVHTLGAQLELDFGDETLPAYEVEELSLKEALILLNKPANFHLPEWELFPHTFLEILPGY